MTRTFPPKLPSTLPDAWAKEIGDAVKDVERLIAAGLETEQIINRTQVLFRAASAELASLTHELLEARAKMDSLVSTAYAIVSQE